MKNGITLEICIENGTRIDELISLGDKGIGKTAGINGIDTFDGIDRVELCDNMAAGGTSVSYGVAENVIARCHKAGITVVSMVRPRGGDFVYDRHETEMMFRDIGIFKDLGSDGVVFGCLTETGSLDTERIRRLLKAAGSMDAVFHMAFDHIRGGGGNSGPSKEQIQSLHWLAGEGFRRILARGSPDASSSAWDNREKIKTLVEEAAGRIGILPGGGVTGENYRELCACLGVSQVHGTRLP
ncbi:MAG: copper homeostasis protein CutC [Treponema sp.]|jgi:copper homeostasis protein|nr:copper homeostasis protein CutC [Treponema sp.]